MERIFDQELLNFISQSLTANGQSIAVAESVTGGMLQNALSCCINASQFYQGGITAYNLDQKCRQLSVEREHAQSVNCVSQQVANEMAINVAARFHADWGIAVTGYASPVPESGNELFAYFSIAFKGENKFVGKLSSNAANVFKVQQGYSEFILKKFYNELAAR